MSSLSAAAKPSSSPQFNLAEQVAACEAYLSLPCDNGSGIPLLERLKKVFACAFGAQPPQDEIFWGARHCVCKNWRITHQPIQMDEGERYHLRGC